MHTERTRDRVVLTAKEVQTILKDYIETASGRKIDGDVIFQKGDNHSSETSAYAHLHYRDEPKVEQPRITLPLPGEPQ